MSTRPDDLAVEDRLRQRSQFFKKYFGPFAVNTRRGFAVVDVNACAILFANSRFLASHGQAPAVRFPLPCATTSGLGAERCPDRANPVCLAQEAARTGQEARTSEVRPAAGDEPARETTIVAIPFFKAGEVGVEREVVLIEKDVATDEQAGTDPEHEYLAAIARYSADAIVGLDTGSRVRSWNRGAEDTFGFTADEAVGRPFDFLVPDNDADRRAYQDLLREFERNDLVKNYQANCITKDGRTVIVNCTRSMFRDAAGKARGISIICRDVTLEVLLRELIEHQLRAMSVIHEIGDVLHSTRSVEEILQLILLGVTAGQGLGFNRAFLLLVEPDESAAAERLRGRLAIGPSNHDEANRIWTNLSGQRLSLGELYERYQKESEEHDAAVTGIVRNIDVPLSDEDHVFVRAVRQRRAFNVVRGEVRGGGARVDASLCQRLLSDTFAAVPLNTRDRSIGVLVVDNLISRLPVTEADLQMLKVFANHAGIAVENSRLRTHLERRLDELNQVNRSLQDNQARLMQAERLSVIGEMAARVAHEVRNPLVSIGGFARLVRKGIAADDPRSDYLRIISDEVARLERIVQELLDFSRPQDRLSCRELDLAALLHETVGMATIEARGQGVRVRETYDPAALRVIADGDRIRQVLLNLIRNSLDAMEGMDGGVLEIETSVEPEDRVRITVRDNGPGIPVEKRDRIFAPGFTTRHQGTGFGLAIAKRIVELHGGRITLRDDVPAGCTFDIVLPRRAVEERIDGSGPETDADPGRG